MKERNESKVQSHPGGVARRSTPESCQTCGWRRSVQTYTQLNAHASNRLPVFILKAGSLTVRTTSLHEGHREGMVLQMHISATFWSETTTKQKGGGGR